MSVHSHAVAPESSGAFFLDMGTERCAFQAGGLRNALRASEAVRATDVMVNTGERDKPSSFIARQEITNSATDLHQSLCCFHLAISLFYTR